jgi:hypothetical protein
MASASVVGYGGSLVVVPIPFAWYIQYSFTHVSTSNRAGIFINPSTNSNPHFQVPFACPPQSSLKAYLCTMATAITTTTKAIIGGCGGCCQELSEKVPNLAVFV